MQTESLLITEWLNQTFNITENIDFISAPYDQYTDTGRFFLNKRYWIDSLVDAGKTILWYWFYQDVTKQEKISIVETKLISFTTSSTSDLKTGLGVDLEIGKISAGWWTQEDTWTATAWTATTLTDTAKTWATNEYAGYYVWISDWTGWWQIKQIQSNTDDTITVNGWVWGVALDNTSVYVVFNQLVITVIISDNSNNKVWYYDGNNVNEVKTIEPFSKSVLYDGRRWSTDNSNPNIVWYSETGDYLMNEWFIDAGIGGITDMFVLWDFLLLFKEDSIFAISKYTDSSGTILYNVSELSSSVGIYGVWAVGMYASSCYFLGSDKQIYNIQVWSDWVNIVGNLTVVGKVLRNYLDALSGSWVCSFIVWDNDFEIIVWNSGFKYWDYLKAWSFNSYWVELLINKKLFWEYYFSYNTNIGSKSITTKTDFWESFVERVWFIFWLGAIFAPKKINSVHWLFWYNTAEKVSASLSVKTYATADVGSLSANLDQNNTGVSTGSYELLWASLLWANLLWGKTIETGASTLFILKKIINRSGYFFQVVLTSDTTYWFDLWEVAILYSTNNLLTHPSKTTL